MSSKHHSHPLPLAVRAALSRLSRAEAGAISSHAQLRRLAASSAFDAALESSCSSSAAAAGPSSEASGSLSAVVDACLSHWSEVRVKRLREKKKE